MADRIDAYRVLGVDPTADEDTIKAAYRRLARRFHPDLASGPEAAARMAEINVAWELVGEAAARRRYDRARGVISHDEPTRSSTTPGQRGTSRMTPPPMRPTPRPEAAPSSTASTASTGSPSPAGSGAGRSQGPSTPPPETVSRDWSSGRSTAGGGYDASMRTADGRGAAGPPPGRASGSVLNFGRYAGWSLGEIARTDIEYLEWLDRIPIGRVYHDEVDQLLRKAGRRVSEETEASERHGLFRRR